MEGVADADPSRLVLEKRFLESDLMQIALITNHGYGGPVVPTGGAPDTGGQNLYVNSLAMALVDLGYKVTVFARGGFAHFGKESIRDSPEYMTHCPLVRYVYLKGGPDFFVRKEDISEVLDEELDHLQKHIAGEAAALNKKPHEVYELINSHYWDAAVLGCELVRRWKDDLALQWLQDLGVDVDESVRRARYASHLSETLAVELGRIKMQQYPFEGSLVDTLALYLKNLKVQKSQIDTATKQVNAAADMNKELLAHRFAGEELLRVAEEKKTIDTRAMAALDTHVWTPHSLGPLKERNFIGRDTTVIRNLKFLERRHHEEHVCRGTDLFVTTSPELSEILNCYFKVPLEKMFFFPPCIEKKLFKPLDQHKPEDVAACYKWLSLVSGLDVQILQDSCIVFETSRMDTTKRKDVVLKSFAKCVASGADAYLFIGGGPSSNPVFKDLAELRKSLPADVQARAFLTGFIPDDVVHTMFAVAGVYVTASEMEGFGMSAAQAAACATPLIASHMTPFATQFAAKESYVVQSGDIDGFAATLLNLINNPTERTERGRAIEIRTQDLTWNALTKSFLNYVKNARLKP